MEENNVSQLNPNEHNPLRSESIELNLNLPKEDEDGITLKEIIIIFKRGLFKIFCFTLIALVIGVIASVVYYFISLEYVGSVTGIISFNYKGAEEGLDPYGRVLDVKKIRSAQVLDKTLTTLDLYPKNGAKGITVEDLRQNIEIEGIIPADAMERILIIKEISTKDPTNLEKLPEVSYIPTQYLVTLKIPKKFSFINAAKAKELLSTILTSYQESFFEEYGDISVLSTAVASLPYDIYDYSEIADIFNGQISNMISYLSIKKNASPEFRANSTQMSFGDIITNLDLLRNIDLNGFQARVEARLLTKDKDRLISIYEHYITMKTLEKEVQLEKARVAQEAADAYEKGTALMFSGVTSTSEAPLMQFSETSQVYDSLITQAAEALIASTQLQSDIAYYEKRIADFQSVGVISNRPSDIAIAEEAITTITEKMVYWIDVINETVDEYTEVEALKDATKILLMPQYTSNLRNNSKMMIIIALGVMGIGFVIGTLSVYMKKLMS